MPWRTRILTPLSPPFGPDGRTTLVDVTVKARRLPRRLDLETDPQWQSAALTETARPWLLARDWEAWAVWYPLWDRQVATVVRFSDPGAAWESRRVVSARPKRITMGPFDRVMLVSDCTVQVWRGAETRWAWGTLANPLAADLLADRLAEQTGIPREDTDAFAEI